MYSDGLWVRVEDLLPRDQWFKSLLEQFVLKTRAVNSILGNRNMIRKIPTWCENSDRGNKKTAGKNSAMVGNFPQWEKISLLLHGSFSTVAPVLYAGIYLPLFSQCIPQYEKTYYKTFPWTVLPAESDLLSLMGRISLALIINRLMLLYPPLRISRA
jgi:hypothetical protein